MDIQTERRLIEQAKTDPRAFGELFDAYYPKILGYAIRRSGDVSTAEDIVANTFVKALKALPRFRWQGVSPEAWLFAIANNELRMHFRKYKHLVSLDMLFEESGFELEDEYDLAAEVQEAQERLERHALFVRAQALILTLPLKYQEVLVLRFGEHKKVAEIAQITGKREGTVKSLISRGLAQLGAKLAVQQATAKTQRSASPRIVVDGGQSALKTSGKRI
jgi:RNA polymerase sigma-70 factor (ECF subfamily)